MYARQTILKNDTGLHTRPASDFVALAKTFSSEISVKRLGDDANEANAKSILSILTKGFSNNTPIEISAEGPDEQQAVDALIALVDAQFSEG